MEIRRLSEHDTDSLWRLREEALREAPASFAESLEEFLQSSREIYRARLRSGSEHSFVIGAFDGQRLVAMCGFYREDRVKRRHKGNVWGVYVQPAYRGKGVGREILRVLIEESRAIPDLVGLYLSAAMTEEPARRLYRSLGFRPFGVEPQALKVDGRYVDEEHMMLPFEPSVI